jgi:protein-disulfide isomerase-like protein with CxxC motif
MKKIVIRRYQDGKKIKTVNIEQDISISFGVENGRFVVRDYQTGKKIRSVQAPACSISFSVEAAS